MQSKDEMPILKNIRYLIYAVYYIELIKYVVKACVIKASLCKYYC